ncbi:hypothetical protein DEAC_c04560 [Desulfosporosinus acididurans]|uniref:Uncharacterized protein n=1 Tax=Desulfosporosinus acididurans TaxID=476652 RepID=A0A0J1FUX2_9FIRM|nr:hypothetical protein DEAC_c04560 [Desulfosporosinus acididurans]
MEGGKLFFIKELDQWNSVSDTIPVVGMRNFQARIVSQNIVLV